MEYLQVNANDQLDLIGSCLSGCSGKHFSFSYNIYTLDNSQANFTNFSYYYQTGMNKSDITLISQLFADYSMFSYWKVELVYNLTTYLNTTLFGISSLTFFINQPPSPGTCDITPKNGTTSDLFTIYCDGWSDESYGTSINYTFYSRIIFLFSFELCELFNLILILKRRVP